MSTQMPWERWSPKAIPEPEPLKEIDSSYTPSRGRTSVPAPEVTYAEEVPLPETQEFDLGETLKKAFKEAIEESRGGLETTVTDYIRETAGNELRGKRVDHDNPKIVATTKAGHELVVADAKSRSWRTLMQGLIIDVFFAIIASVAMLSGADPFVKETWMAFGVLLLKSVLSAVVSYFMRLRVTPTIKTPGHRMAIMPIPRVEIEDDDEWKERSA